MIGWELEEVASGQEQEEESYYSDTLNQILLPVTLIFIYILATMANNLLQTKGELDALMKEWTDSDKHRLILELQKQELVRAFEKIRDESKKELGLDLLESGTFDFHITLRPDRSTDSLYLKQIIRGKVNLISLKPYGQKIQVRMAEEANLKTEGEKLFRRVLDDVKMNSVTSHPVVHRNPEHSRNVQVENAVFLYQENILPYLANSEREIVEFQQALIIELAKSLRKKTEVWKQWDPVSFHHFESHMDLLFEGKIVEADSRKQEMYRHILKKLRLEIQSHYFVLGKAWDEISGLD